MIPSYHQSMELIPLPPYQIGVPRLDYIDDTKLLGRDPGKISRIIVLFKTYVWGIHIFYEDGSSTGLHCGYMEPTIMPVSKELVLEKNEHILKIACYVGVHIGVIIITTTLGRTLEAGSIPVGVATCIKADGFAIRRLVFGYDGYLNYIGAWLFPCLVKLPSFKLPNVEFSAIYGNESPEGKPFDDYKEIAEKASIKGFNVRLSRLKIYYDDDGITGIKPVYEVTDFSGSVVKVEAHHRPEVGFFQKILPRCVSTNFSPGNSPKYIKGYHNPKGIITSLQIISNEPKEGVSYGTGKGVEFSIVPEHKGPIIAFAGSVGKHLYTLRVYSTY